MPIVALIAAAAGLAWGVVYARRGSLVLGCAALLVVAYVFGHAFWHVKVGPLPLTLDRLVLVGLLAAFVAQWRWGRIERKPLTGCDWLLAGLLAVLTASAIVAGQPEVAAADAGPPLWRLTMSFFVPAALYWVARQAPLARRQWIGWLVAMSLLGVYLAVTALAEFAGEWALVFPRYIADPALGIHFGRARGPELNSASLGIYLTACLWCAWTLRGQVRRGWQLAILAAVPLMALGVLVTYTRSTWLGLVASGSVVALARLPRRWRLPAFAMATLAGVVIAAAAWSDLVELRREGTAGDAHHSVDQRQSFAYVSWQMFKDHPVLGVGFGRFYDRKLPYLSDRSQNLELESLRPLHHHNTLLGLVTETGMVGLAAFVALVAAWGRTAWSLVCREDNPSWVRSHGLLMLAVIVSYLSSAMFHELTLLPTQQWLLFVLAGLTVNLRLASVEQGAKSVEQGAPRTVWHAVARANILTLCSNADTRAWACECVARACHPAATYPATM
jgi:O-antigen ligase